MQSFNAKEKSVKELLSSNSTLFNIPAYQRTYSWDKDEALTLYEDIYKFSLKRKVNESYYIGNVILQQDLTKSHSTKNVYQIVDGQQRITTILLILAALRNEVNRRIENKIGDERILYSIELDLKRLLYFDDEGQEALQLKVYNKDYNDNMVAVIENTINDVVDEEELEKLNVNKKYIDNYNQIHMLGVKRLKDENDFKSLLNALESVVMVDVTLSPNDDALTVFENINSKGHELDAHDLIKNYSYILASKLPVEYRNDFDEQISELFDTKIKSKIEDKKLSTFWRVTSSMIGRTVQPINKNKEIYNHFKESIRKRVGLSAMTDPSDLKEAIEKLIFIINRNFQIYTEITSYEDSPYLYKERWQRSLASMVTKSFDSVAPMLFKAYNDYKDNNIDENELKELIVAINKYKLRLKLTKAGIKDLKNMSMKLVEHMSNPAKKTYLTKKSFLNYISQYDGDKDDKYRKNPDDIVIKKALKENEIYDNGVALEILIEYEVEQSKNELSMTDSTRKIQVEHIMPQKIWNKSKSEYYKGWEHIDLSEHIDNLNNLGNLTLTFDNPEMGNSEFSTKKKTFKESNLRLNNYFEDINSWDIDEIETRRDLMIQEVIKQWKI